VLEHLQRVVELAPNAREAGIARQPIERLQKGIEA
jgi:hypothetical protein